MQDYEFQVKALSSKPNIFGSNDDLLSYLRVYYVVSIMRV